MTNDHSDAKLTCMLPISKALFGNNNHRLLLFTLTAVAGGGLTSVCLCVCLFYSHDISKTNAVIGLPNLTQKCSNIKISPGNPFILGWKGQRSRWRVTKSLPAWVVALLWVLASS